ncbi:uncharacterized protein F4822DRAFT_413044 [Hypoxylon trugodes]|uniref:uncharacterized protein n=1 Tax=Hypoxylon trugodes TaxID=326681 RepID=UPI00219D0240|nr:uncharacterized protein F4822DRAFT_413044 [Hypoxylon trugodes]KAI1385445.1 hypothetical protein F4822DRAFT_413044 [Hypoxylon trugodes]
MTGAVSSTHPESTLSRTMSSKSKSSGYIKGTYTHPIYRGFNLAMNKIYLSYLGKPPPAYITTSKDEIFQSTETKPPKKMERRRREYPELISGVDAEDVVEAEYRLWFRKTFIPKVDEVNPRSNIQAPGNRVTIQDYHQVAPVRVPKMPISTPKPDSVFGYKKSQMPTALLPAHAKLLKDGLYLANGLLWPYFVHVYKGHKESLYLAENQLCGSMAYGIWLGYNLGEATGENVTVTSHDFASIGVMFSLTSDLGIAKLYVGWKDESDAIQIRWLRSYLNDTPESINELRETIDRIHKWGKKRRQAIVMALDNHRELPLPIKTIEQNDT